jgi:predicted nucleotidyltransferase
MHTTGGGFWSSQQFPTSEFEPLRMPRLTDAKLADITERIVQALRPRQVVLFGSHAWGHPTDASDADLLVVVDESEEPGYRLAQRAYRALFGVGYPCDVLVHTRQEVDEARRVKASLLNRIMAQGKVLYG